MFCSICGSKNNDANIYCINDGFSIQQNNKNLVLYSSSNQFCQECGNETKKENSYCSNCGASLFKVKELNKFEIPKIENFNVEFDKVENLLNSNLRKLNLKSSFIYGIVGSLLVFIISLLASSKFNEIINSVLSGEFGSVIDTKFLNPLSIFPFLNLGTAKFKLDVLEKGFTAKISFGLYLFSLIPFFTFIGLGLFKGYYEKEKNKLIDLIYNSLVYSLISGVFALIGSRKIEVPLGAFDFLGSSPFINLGFSVLSVIFKSFILSLLGFGIGYSIINLIKKIKFTTFEKAIYKGFTTFGVLMIVILIINQIGIRSNLVDNIEIEDQIASSQMAIYSFGIANIGKLNIISEFENIGVSLFSNLSEVSDYLFTNISENSLYISIILIFITFFALGFKAKRNKEEHFYITPIVYSIALSLYMYILNLSFSYTGLGENMKSIGYAFSLIYTLIGSLLLSGVSTFAGYFLGGSKNE